MIRILSMNQLDRAFTRARADVRAVGLLDAVNPLDRVECVRAALPSIARETGYVFDRGVPWYLRMVGFRAGVIYVPLNAPVVAYAPGETLVDTIRHEFGHAWAWCDRAFVERRWFRDAFGARYGDDWAEPPAYDPDEFVSEYACTRPAEDFCETFMTLLRCRRSLHRYDHRAGVQAKLRAVARAVSIVSSRRPSPVRSRS